MASARPFGQRPPCAVLLMAVTTAVALLLAQGLSAAHAGALVNRADAAILEYLQAGGSRPSATDVRELLIRTDPVEAMWVTPASLSSADRVLLGFCEREGVPASGINSILVAEEGTTLLVRQVSEGVLYHTVPGDATVLVFTDLTMPFAAHEAARRQLCATLCVIGPAAGLAIWLGVRAASRARQRSRDFFANAAHELRTPLVAVQGYASGLENGAFTQSEAVAVISAESQRMGVLVDNILALSKVQARRVTPVVTACDLCGEVADALDTLRPEAEARGVELRLMAPNRLIVETDCELLQSMLLNVVSNAVRHAESRVSVTVRSQSGAAVVRVANDGKPISKEEARRVFDRFYSSEAGHTGIGMALVKEYAALLGATVTLGPEDGFTVCRLELPA